MIDFQKEFIMKKKKYSSEIKFIPNPSAGIGFFNSTTAAGQSTGGMGEELENTQENKMDKKQIKETLNKIDNSCIDRSLKYYNLTGLYESANLSKEDEEDLGKVLFELKDQEKVSEKDTAKLHDMLKYKEKEEEEKRDVSKDVKVEEGLSFDEFLTKDFESATQTEDMQNEKVTDFDKETIKADIENTVRDSLKRKLGYDDEFVDENVVVEVEDYEDDRIKVELRWEIDYDEGMEVIKDLDNTIKKYDPEAYFEHDYETILNAFVRKDQSEDIVDDELFGDYKEFIDSSSTREDFIRVRDIMDNDKELNTATHSAIIDYMYSAIDRIGEMKESADEELKESYNIMTIADIREGSIGNMSDEEIDLDEKIFSKIGRYFDKNSDDVYVVVADGDEVEDPQEYSDVFDSYSDSNLFGQRMKDYDIRVLHIDLNGKRYEVIREVRNGRVFLYFEDDYNANDFIDGMKAEIKSFYGESWDNDSSKPAKISFTSGKKSVETTVEKAKESMREPSIYPMFFTGMAGGTYFYVVNDAGVYEKEQKDESLTESEDEKPHTYRQVEKELRDITTNFTNKSGTVKCGFEQEKEFGKRILQKHYEIVEVSGDDIEHHGQTWEDYYVISYTNPKKRNKDESLKESMEDFTETFEVTADQIPDNEYPFLNLAVGEGYIKVFTDGGDFYDFKCLNRNKCDKKVVYDLGTWAKDIGLKRFTENRYQKQLEKRVKSQLGDLKESAELQELEQSLIGKEFDKEEVFAKLRKTFNDNAISHMHPEMRTTLGLAYLIEDQTGENVMGVEWEEKDGKIVVTYIDFIDDSEVVDDDNDTIDESKNLTESSLQLGKYVVKDGDLDIVAEYHWDKGNTYQVTVGDYKDSIQYGPLMFDRRYYTEEDAKRAFNRKVRELKRNYENRSNAL